MPCRAIVAIKWSHGCEVPVNQILAHTKCSTTESNNGALWDGCKQSPLHFCYSQELENPAIKSETQTAASGRARSLLPAQAALRGLGDTASSGHSWLTCWFFSLGSDRRGTVTLESPRVHSGQSPRWLSHHVCPHRAAGQGAGWSRPPRDQPQVPRLPEEPHPPEPGIH